MANLPNMGLWAFTVGKDMIVAAFVERKIRNIEVLLDEESLEPRAGGNLESGMRTLRRATVVVLSASTSADTAPLLSERVNPEVLRSFDLSSLVGVFYLGRGRPAHADGAGPLNIGLREVTKPIRLPGRCDIASVFALAASSLSVRVGARGCLAHAMLKPIHRFACTLTVAAGHGTGVEALRQWDEGL